MSELRKKVLAEIDALYEKDIDENLEKNLKLLYDYIKDEKNLKDDQDIRIFLYTNKDHAAIKPYSKIDDTDFTAINQIITGTEPKLIKEDIKLKEVFGETYTDPGVLDKRKGEDLKKLTDAKNVNLYDALKVAEDEAVKKDREEAFYGTNWLQQIFTPRLYERRMRGETTDDLLTGAGKDLALDVLENAAYTFLPGNALKLLGRIPTRVATAISKNKLANVAFDAASSPIAMEAVDASVYDENDNTDRSEFSKTDATIGAAVNLLIPEIIKGPLSTVGRVAGGESSGPMLSQRIGDLGKGKTVSDISRDAKTFLKPMSDLNRVKSGLKNQQGRLKQKSDEIKNAQNNLDRLKAENADKYEIEKAQGLLDYLKEEQPTTELVDFAKVYKDQFKYKEYDPRLLDYVPELKKLDETLKNLQKNKNWLTNVNAGTYKQKAELVDDVLKTTDLDVISKNNVRDELLDIIKDVKFDSDKALETFLLNYIANKYSDIVYKDRESNLPFIGDALKRLKEEGLKEERQKVRDRFSKMLLPEVKPVKPDNTKESN